MSISLCCFMNSGYLSRLSLGSAIFFFRILIISSLDYYRSLSRIAIVFLIKFLRSKIAYGSRSVMLNSFKASLLLKPLIRTECATASFTSTKLLNLMPVCDLYLVNGSFLGLFYMFLISACFFRLRMACKGESVRLTVRSSSKKCIINYFISY